MADPKYANLPGIDLDQPDTYETSDLPEDDQNRLNDDDSEAIEKINVKPNDAFGRFKGKEISSDGTDFSDKVALSRKTGYDARTEYEIAEGEVAVKETPQQKYQRLQHEIRELTEEVNGIKENVKADASTEKLSPVVLARQVEYLQHQLADLHLDKLLGPNSELSLADPQGALQKRLMTELDAYKPLDPAKPTKAAAGGDSTHVTYQLYYRPEQAKFSNNARMADIEQRVERLEAVIGNSPEKLSVLTADTNNKCLLASISTLSTKMRLLDASQLDQIEGRLSALSHRLTQVTEKKEAIEDKEKMSKVNELYVLVKKWDTMAHTLPHVVDRLTALKDLHEQALQFSQALTHLDTAQQQVEMHLKAHADMHKQVQTTLKDNLGTIKDNCDSIDNRIKTLSKKK